MEKDELTVSHPALMEPSRAASRVEVRLLAAAAKIGELEREERGTLGRTGPSGRQTSAPRATDGRKMAEVYRECMMNCCFTTSSVLQLGSVS